MKGADLKYVINNCGIKIKDIAKKSGIIERTIYSLYEKDEVEQHYIDKLESAGIKLHKATLSQTENKIYLKMKKENEELKKEIKRLSELIELQRELLSVLRTTSHVHVKAKQI